MKSILKPLIKKVTIDVLEILNITNDTSINDKISDINEENNIYCSENQNLHSVGKCQECPNIYLIVFYYLLIGVSIIYVVRIML